MFHLRKIPEKTWVKLMFVSFAVAVVLRLYQEFLLPDLLPDKMVQLITARQLSLGHGISYAYSLMGDLSQTRFELISVWAPGYALVIAPLFLAGLDFFWASLVVDAFAILIFFGAWFYTLWLLKPWLKPRVLVLIPLYWAVAYSPFRLVNSTDLLSLAFFSLSWALLFRILLLSREGSGPGYGLIFWFSLVSFLGCFFRFAYYPVAILMPALLLLYAVLENRAVLKKAIVAFMLTGGFIVGQLLYQGLYANSVIYMNQYHPEPQTRLFFEHLLKFDPVFINAFMHDFILKKGLSGASFFWFSLIFSALVLGVLGAGGKKLVSFHLNGRSWKKLGAVGWFFVFGMLLSVTIVLFLTALSLRYPIQVEGNWTFVQEARYYAPVYVMVFLLICLSLYNNLQPAGQQGIRFVAKGILGAGFLFSVLFFGYTLSRYSLTDGRANMHRYYHYSTGLLEFLKEYSILNAPVPVVFSAENFYSPTSWFLALEGASLVPADSLLQQNHLQASLPVNLLVVVDKVKGDSTNQALERFAQLHKGRKLVTLPDVQADIWEIKVNGGNSGR